MKTIENVLSVLKEQGLTPIVDQNMLSFSYKKLNFLYLQDEEDDTYFSMYIPGICEVDSKNESVVLQAVNQVNGTMRMVKLAVHGSFVWIGVELSVYENSSVINAVRNSLDLLCEALRQFIDLLCELSDPNRKYVSCNCCESVHLLLN